MAVKQLWTSPPQFVDANGDPYSGALLFFYVAGSSTKQDTFTDSTGNTACPNPITLNSSGYPAVSGTIVTPWGTAGQTYKIGLAVPGSSDPPSGFIWTDDNISPINDTSVTLDQWVSGPAPTYVSATQFTLVGDQTSTFQVGRRVKTTNSGGTVYSTISASAYTVLTTVTVVNDSGTLDSGLSAVSYGLLSATNPSVPKIALQATSINFGGSTLSTYSESSYTATLTGCTTAPTYTVTYTRIGNAVIMDIPANTATSNSTAKTLTGGPAAMRPSTSKRFPIFVLDNGSVSPAMGEAILDSAGTFTLAYNIEGVFTAANTYAMRTISIAYTLT